METEKTARKMLKKKMAMSYEECIDISYISATFDSISDRIRKRESSLVRIGHWAIFNLAGSWSGKRKVVGRW
jgi:hypothetical protein